MYDVSMIDGHIDEPKMTDDEIVADLEAKTNIACSMCKVGKSVFCNGCVYHYTKQALDLINRQKADVERLNKLLIEKYMQNDKLHEYLQYTKAEAYKEFAERLKLNAYTECSITGYKYQVVQIEEIDNLVKELAGEDNAETKKP